MSADPSPEPKGLMLPPRIIPKSAAPTSFPQSVPNPFEEAKEGGKMDLTQFGLLKAKPAEPTAAQAGAESAAAQAGAMGVELKYKEPYWSAPAAQPVRLEVIKDGRIVQTIELTGKGSFLIGKIPLCDVTLDHPSSSRQHAVLQHKQGKFFLFDLESVHGTFLNKSKLRPKVYTELNSGDQIKFGNSTRVPTEAAEAGEGELSRAQVQRRREEERERRAEEVRRARDGLQEEAEAPEGKKAKDPARAGEVFEGSVEEATKFMRKHGQKGVPKNAKQLMETAGQMVAMKKKSQRELKGEGEGEEEEEEDPELAEGAPRVIEEYFEEADDDDDFFDRTNRTRQKIASRPRVETYASLTAQRDQALAQRQELLLSLAKAKAAQAAVTTGDEEDELDSFMAASDSRLHAETVQRREAELAELDVRLAEFERLVRLAAPALAGLQAESEEERQKRQARAREQERLALEARLRAEEARAKQEEEEAEAESRQAAEAKAAEPEQDPEPQPQATEEVERLAVPAAATALAASTDLPPAEPYVPAPKWKAGLNKLSSLKRKTVLPSLEELMVESQEVRLEEAVRAQHDRRKEQAAKRVKQQLFDDEVDTDSAWVPPTGQTGDGRTALNEKFGY